MRPLGWKSPNQYLADYFNSKNLADYFNSKSVTDV